MNIMNRSKITWRTPPTLEEFYKNPSGKGVTANNISSVRYVMKSRYDILTDKLEKKIPVHIYMENENSFYFHIVIPSDMRDYDYDVVVHLYDFGEDSSSSLKKWNCAFFSNCPSFVFAFAYAYNMNGIFIPFLANKLGRKALTELPGDKNPDLQVSWDKSIYYAIETLMKNIKYTQRFVLKRNAAPFSEAIILKSVRSFDEVMKDLETKKKDKFGVKKQLHTSKTQRRIKEAKEKIKKGANTVKDVVSKGIEAKMTATKHHYNSKGKVVGKPKIKGTHRKK